MLTYPKLAAEMCLAANQLNDLSAHLYHCCRLAGDVELEAPDFDPGDTWEEWEGRLRPKPFLTLGGLADGVEDLKYGLQAAFDELHVLGHWPANAADADARSERAQPTPVPGSH